MGTLYGCDVSHYQSVTAPGGVPWSKLRETGCEFVMVRATYGTSRDPSAAQHVRAARSVGLGVGLYHFFRSTQPVTDQLAAFVEQAVACGIRAGDIAPALDLEDDISAKLEPSWSEAASALVAGLVSGFGEAMVYVTQRDFGRLGKPAWVLERPLWVAHYTASASPATPGNAPWRIWQHRVGPWVPGGQGGAFQPQVLDQNRAQSPLPLCTRAPDKPGSVPPPSGPSDEEHNQRVAMRLAALLTADLDLTHDTEPAPPPEEA